MGDDLQGVFGGRVVTTVLIGYKERVEANPKAYRELLRMLKESSDYVRKAPDEVYRAVAAKAKIDPDFFADWFAKLFGHSDLDLERRHPLDQPGLGDQGHQASPKIRATS